MNRAFVIVALGAVLLFGCDSSGMGEAERRYDTAYKAGSFTDRCRAAGDIVERALTAGDVNAVEEWKDRERVDCAAARLEASRTL